MDDYGFSKTVMECRELGMRDCVGPLEVLCARRHMRALPFGLWSNQLIEFMHRIRGPWRGPQNDFPK